MGRTLYQKVYDAHIVTEIPGELPLLYIDRHLIHEVTSPQAFAGLRDAGGRSEGALAVLSVFSCLRDISRHLGNIAARVSSLA